MAEPIGVASGLLTLVVFAFQSSKFLYEAISSFQNNQRSVRELKEELEALEGVLQSLRETAANPDVDLTALALPLLRCGNACKDFGAVIIKCTAHSEGPRTSFRDWAKLKYMGDDIVGFKNTLAGYKSTIIIALVGANMLMSAVSVSVVKEYKQIIANTTSDLEEHLQDIDRKLQALPPDSARISDIDSVERQKMQEERDSTQQCLGICAQVYKHIEQVQPSSTGSNSPTRSLPGITSARLVTAEHFKTCKDSLTIATATLERNLQEINKRIQALPSGLFELSASRAAEKARLQEEMESTKQSLAICATASTQADMNRTNVFEDISMTDDGQQVFVSTIGDLISARRITAGARSQQLMGQMSDESVQQFAQNRPQPGPEKTMEPQTGPPGSPFAERYGTGVTLSSQRLNDTLRHIHIEGSS